jgi:hypothetical protein
MLEPAPGTAADGPERSGFQAAGCSGDGQNIRIEFAGAGIPAPG